MIFLKKKIGGEPPNIFSYKCKLFLNLKEEQKIYFCSSGREAILKILEHENINNVFIPNYYCYPVFSLIKNLKGIQLHGYSSQKELLSKIKKVDETKKKLIILLFFNGMQESLEEYEKFINLDSKSIITILDAAMTPFLTLSKFRFNYLITNPRKFYRFPFGSLIFCNPDKKFRIIYNFNPIENIEYLFVKVFSRVLLNLRINFLEKIGLILNRYAEKKVPLKSDLFTNFFLKNLKFKDLRKIRIEQHNLYHQLLKPISNKFIFLKQASNEDCPFGFMIRLKNREKLVKFLSKERIFVSILWQIPKYMIKDFDFETIKKTEEIVVFPIGPQYSRKDIEKVCKLTLNFLKNEINL